MSEPRILTQDGSAALARRILEMCTTPITYVSINSNVSGYTRFARNAMTAAGDSESVSVRVASYIDGNTGSADTNQLDDASLLKTVRAAEGFARKGLGEKIDGGALGPQTYLNPKMWFEGSLAMLDAKERAAVTSDALRVLSSSSLSGAGFVDAFAMSGAAYNNHGMAAYRRATNASITVTGRTTDGTGSGWVGAEFNDWSRVTAQAIVSEAVETARRSAKPVAVEPGKYTVILEPGALAALFAPVMRNSSLSRASSEGGATVFSKPDGGTRIGSRMLDPRLSIVADPEHPTGSFAPFDIYGTPINRTVWFENGVLRNLATSFVYPLRDGHNQVINTEAFQMSGGDDTFEEMVASTRLGFWIKRIGSLQTIDMHSMLMTGVTRDGIFLIENGQVTRPVKNFRFNESPFFILNNLEMVGNPVRVPGRPPAVVPRVKVRDFTFTSLSDAV